MNRRTFLGVLLSAPVIAIGVKGVIADEGIKRLGADAVLNKKLASFDSAGFQLGDVEWNEYAVQPSSRGDSPWDCVIEWAPGKKICETRSFGAVSLIAGDSLCITEEGSGFKKTFEAEEAMIVIGCAIWHSNNEVTDITLIKGNEDE